MTVSTIALGKEWTGPLPTKALIFVIGETAGKALNVRYTAVGSYSGEIDMPELLAKKPTGKAVYHNKKNSNPEPTALSVRIEDDIYLGFILSKSMDTSFADVPFSGGYADAAQDYMQVTRVSDTSAYMLVRGSQFPRPDCSKPFNIHLVATGTFGDGVAYSTPIIIDPDGRWPDGGGTPG
jgi:hypothetical protein